MADDFTVQQRRPAHDPTPRGSGSRLREGLSRERALLPGSLAGGSRPGAKRKRGKTEGKHGASLMQQQALLEAASPSLDAVALRERLRQVACVSLPELPLQLLLREHPRWRECPVALVAEERPESPLLLINGRARRSGLRTGMRFGVAKSLVPGLCAAAIGELELEQAAYELVQALQTFSPHVERDPAKVGVFYLDPRGLEDLYGGQRSWARSVYRFVRGKGYYGSLVVGHGRTLSYAVAQVSREIRVLADEVETLQQAHRVPLERLGMQPKLRDGLQQLGLITLGDLARFGADALQVRFGAEAAQWCRVAQGFEVLPLCAEPHVEAVRAEVAIEPPDTDVARLCFALKRGLHQVSEQLVHQGQSAGALWLTLKLERGGQHRERLEPARASRETGLWLELLRLRLASVALEGPVAEAVIEVDGVRAAPGQVALFATGRDLAAGDRALARVRAMFGEHSVRRASLREGHLPEAKFRWEPVPPLEPPRPMPRQDEPAPLVRQLLRKPEAFEARWKSAPGSGQCLQVGGETLTLIGPYRLSGGWWVREVTRDYYYAESESGQLHWVFYDRARGGWFVHALVD